MASSVIDGVSLHEYSYAKKATYSIVPFLNSKPTETMEKTNVAQHFENTFCLEQLFRSLMISSLCYTRQLLLPEDFRDNTLSCFCLVSKNSIAN